MTFIEDAHELLATLGAKWYTTSQITKLAEQLDLEYPKKNLPGLLTRLEGLGFLERQSEDDHSPIKNAQWRVTRQGNAFLRLPSAQLQISENKTESISAHELQIVATLPPAFRKTFLVDHPELLITYEAFENAITETKSELRIICPYIDQSILGSLQNALKRGVKIQIISTASSNAPSRILKRLQKSGVKVRYIYHEEDQTQIYHVHAKSVIVDSKKAYIGSSNLTSTSLYYNFELGLMTDNHALVTMLIEIFDDLFENYATEEPI